MKKYNVGDIIKCKVTGIESYGIFVNVDENYQGLIHISEVSSSFVRNTNDYVSIGDIIYSKVIKVDEENKHLSLSIKNIDYINTGEERDYSDDIVGFEPLKENLQVWMKEKLEEYEKK